MRLTRRLSKDLLRIYDPKSNGRTLEQKFNAPAIILMNVMYYYFKSNKNKMVNTSQTLRSSAKNVLVGSLIHYWQFRDMSEYRIEVFRKYL